MLSAMVRYAAVAASLMTGIYLGGPVPISDARLASLVGADDPPAPNCTTTGLKDPALCLATPRNTCQQSVVKCKQANVGIKQTSLCDTNNGGQACATGGTCVPDTKDAIADPTTNKCTEFIVPNKNPG